MASEKDDLLIWSMQGFDQGLVTNVAAHNLDGDASPDAENFNPSVRYMLQKRLGTTNFTGNHGSPTGTLIKGLAAFTYENGTTEIIAKEGTAIYNVTAGNWNTTITGHPALSDGDGVHFVMFKNVVIMTSEEAAPIAPQKKSVGGTFSALGGSPPSGQYCCIHSGRVWIAGTAADPSRVYFSAVNNHEDWSTADNAGNFYCAPGDGMVINGIASDGETLYISKKAPTGSEGAIYMVSGNSAASFTPPRRICWEGVPNARCFTITKSFLAAAISSGIYGLQGNRLVFLSDAVNDQWRSLTVAQQAVACIGRWKDQIWVAYPASGSTNTKGLIVDINYQNWSRYNPVAIGMFCTHPDGTLYGASATSTIKVMQMNTGADDQGSAITMYWNTPDIDYGQWFLDKKWREMSLHVKNQAVTWTITHTIDGTNPGDSVTMVGNTEGPVKFFYGLASETPGRFFRFKISESNATLTGEAYGIMTAAESFGRR